MAFHLDGATLHQSCRTDIGIHGFGNAQGQAFGSPPRFEKFGERGLDDFKSFVFQLLFESIAGFIHHHHPIDIHRVTGEVDGIGFGQGNSFVGGNPHLDQTVGVEIEGGRIVE